jgi:8-oxo-dGTP diphosphatase
MLVACAIIEKNGKILAAKRGGGRPHGGFWEFPGGKIGPGEDAEKAIVREIREELGADIAIKKRLPPLTFDYPDTTVTLVPFVCEVSGGPITPLEHEEIRWVDKAESGRLGWLPPDLEILKNYWNC